MKRAITSEVLNPLSQKILSGEIGAGNAINLTVDKKGELVVEGEK